MGRGDLAGAAHLELVSGVAQLRPGDAMFDAMLRGWRAQQKSRGMRDQFGRYGMLNVRYGKAKRGQPPRRRNVLSMMGWAVEAVADYAENVRPRFGYADHPALWITERGSRVRPSEINARFVAYRDALGLPRALTVHSERHAYVTHLIEDGWDPRFVRAGRPRARQHHLDLHVSDDFMNTALSRALAPALTGAGV